MSKSHPLSDELIKDLWDKTSASMDNMEDPILYQFIRAAYDKGAADKLEQATDWLNNNVGMLILSTESELSDRYLDSLEEEFIHDLKKTMRPQQQDQQHPLNKLTEQMMQDALDAVDTDRKPSLIMFDETGPWTEHEREVLREYIRRNHD